MQIKIIIDSKFSVVHYMQYYKTLQYLISYYSILYLLTIYYLGHCELFNVPEEKYSWVVLSIPCHPELCVHALTVLHKSHLTKENK